MFNKHAIKAAVFFAMSQTLSFSEKAVAAAAGTVSEETVRNGAPTTSVTAQRILKQPALDLAGMTREELEAKIQTMHGQLSQPKVANRSMRFNDGSDPNLYEEGEQRVKGDNRAGVAKKGEVKSARASGTISIYGFGRNPFSLYPSQWIELFLFAPEVCAFIRDNVDHINEYVRTQNNGRTDRDVNTAQLDELLAAYELLTVGEKTGADNVAALAAAANIDDTDPEVTEGEVIE